MRHMFIAQDKKITEPSVMMATRERAWYYEWRIY
jgi:hypothetical protein